MQCQQCGHPLSATNHFCPNCGIKIVRMEHEQDLSQIEQLLNEQRFCQAIDYLQTLSSPKADELRTRAQTGFDATVAEIIKRGSRPRWGSRPFDAEQASALRDDLLGAHAILNDPQEADGYTQALIARVEAQEVEVDARERRGMLYAARALASVQYQAVVAQLMAHYGFDGDTNPPVAIPTTALTIPLDVADMLDDDSGLSALEQSEEALRNNQLEASANYLQEAQQRLGSNSTYQPRLTQLAAQIEALRSNFQDLRTIFDQPLMAWMEQHEQIQSASKARFEELYKLFDSDHPRILELRHDFTTRVQTWQSAQQTLDQLGELQDSALETILKDLQAQGLSEHRLVIDAQELLTKQKKLRETKEQSESYIKEYRQLKAEADNLYSEIDVKLDHITGLRSDIERASKNAIVPPADNPIDPETFDFYDLLFANRFRDINTISDDEQSVATYQNLKDFVNAYQSQIKVVARLEREHDPNEHEKLNQAKHKLKKLEDQVRESITKDAQETLASVDALLAQYDYITAEGNLEALKMRLTKAGIALDAELQEQIDERTEKVTQFAEQQKKAEDLIKQAKECAEQTPADFAAAFKYLDQAEQEADWLKERLEEQRTELYKGIDTQLDLASTHVSSGNEERLKKARAILNHLANQPLKPEQKQKLSNLGNAITQQEINRQRIEEIRSQVREIAKQAKEGQKLDEVHATIRGYRITLGAKDSPNFAIEVWEELTELLDTAESRITHWRRYAELLLPAQQAAMEGKCSDVDTAFETIQAELGTQTYLPISTDRQKLRKQAASSSQEERFQAQLSDLQQDLEKDPSRVSTERIETILQSARSFSKDADILSTCDTIDREYLDLFRTRDTLAAAIEANDFPAFDTAYKVLTDTLQKHSLIKKLSTQAQQARKEIQLQSDLKEAFSKARLGFAQGWSAPQQFLDAVRELRTFADQLPAPQRQNQARLDAATLAELEALGQNLSAVCSAKEAGRYDEAHEKIEQAFKQIPAPGNSDARLSGYSDDLTGLRDKLKTEKDQLKSAIANFQKAKGNFTEILGSSGSAFDPNKLDQVRLAFNQIIGESSYDKIRTESEGYIAIIDRIKNLLVRTDACVQLYVRGSTNKHGAEREERVTNEINSIQNEAKAIQADPLGKDWVGISLYDRYKILASHTHIAAILARADLWLGDAEQAMKGKKIGQIENLIQEATRLIGDMGSDFPQSSDDTSLKRISDELNRLRTRVNSTSKELENKKETLISRKRRGIIILALSALLVLVILVLSAIPSIRVPVTEGVVMTFVGTLTPTPSPTIDPGVIAAQTAAAQATIQAQTPTPTLVPTPIPPQPALVVFPGTISVRNRPNVNLARINVLRGGDKVTVTGFCNASDGVRWYHIHVPDKNLMNVWVLAEADDGHGVMRPSLAFPDNNDQPRPELQMTCPE